MSQRPPSVKIRRMCFQRWKHGEPVRLTCHVCKREMDPVREGWHAEHVVPRANGGSDEPGNVRPCCVRCHTEKTKKDVAGSRPVHRADRRRIRRVSEVGRLVRPQALPR